MDESNAPTPRQSPIAMHHMRSVEVLALREDLEGHDGFFTAVSQAVEGAEEPRQGDRIPVIVVLSLRSLTDPAFLESVTRLSNRRPIPVLIGDISRESVPDGLHAVQWIQWAGNREAFAAQLLGAISFSAEESLGGRSLALRAHAWEAGGRDALDLLQTKSEASILERRMRVLGPTELEWEYLLKSRARIRRKSIARRGRAGLAMILVGSLVIGAVSVWRTLSYVRHKNAISILWSAGDFYETSGDVQAIKIGGLLHREIRESRPVTGVAHEALVAALATEWPVSRYSTSPSGNYFTGVAFSREGGELLLSDGFGQIWTVRDWQAPPQLLADTKQNYLTKIAGNSDAVVCAAGDTTAIQIANGEVHSAQLPGPVVGIELSADDSYCLIGAGGEVGLVYLDNPDHWQQIGKGRVHDVNQVRGLPQALVEDDAGNMTLLSVEGAQPVDNPPRGADWFSISPSGVIYGAGINTPLWERVGSEWISTGIPIPGVVETMTTYATGVVISTSHRAAFTYDSRADVVLEATCGSTRLYEASVSRDGRTIACLGGTNLDVRSVDAPKPVDSENVAPEFPGGATLEVFEDYVRYQGPSGSVDVRLDPSGMWRASAAQPRSPVSATDDGNGHILVGYNDGMVAGFSVVGTYARIDSLWMLPTEAPVSEVRWARDGEGASAVAGELVWDVQTCAGCGADVLRALDVVQHRKPWCLFLSTDDLGLLDSEYLRSLGVVDCAQ